MGQDQQSGGGVPFLKKLRVNSSIRRYSLGARGGHGGGLNSFLED